MLKRYYRDHPLRNFIDLNAKFNENTTRDIVNEFKQIIILNYYSLYRANTEHDFLRNTASRHGCHLESGLLAAIEDVAADLGLLDHVPVPTGVDISRVIPQGPARRIVHRAG